MSRVHLAVTIGDPTSIGPEVAAKGSLKFLLKNKNAVLHFFCSNEQLPASSRESFEKYENVGRVVFHANHATQKIFKSGNPSALTGAFAYQQLWRATQFCLSGRADALVTGPLDKFYCSKTNPRFSGHTEFLRKECGADFTTMLLAGETVRVALVTQHIPLSKVSKVLTKSKIKKTVLQTAAFYKPKAHLALCGLNPHASDRGLFGSEEAKLLIPTVKELRKQGILIEGPLPSDSLFHRAQDFDAIICLYHDQGLIPLKMKHFYDAVNITLGLPFLRTSVDHGTAFDIAGKNKASFRSFFNALTIASDRSARR